MQREQSSAAVDAGLYVVGIGASAGGLDALERFFENMPAQPGVAFVVVQHLSPDFKSLMGELLGRRTSMTIRRVEDGMAVEPDVIYLIPPKKNMVFSAGRLHLREPDQSSAVNLPIDAFFRSLAEDAGNRAIGVVLSGTGSDGSRGIKDIHDAGGLLVVQQVDSASFDGMPRNAIATGLADVVAPPEKMANKILQYVRAPATFPRGADEEEPVNDGDERAAIFRMFRQRYGIDFTFYKAATVNRRLERRLQLTRTRDLASYVKRLDEDPQEIDCLYRDLLVEVTQFFRDGDAFGLLRTGVIPEIASHAHAASELRVWVPGCATGEEAYTLAMLFDEAIQRNQIRLDLKVFATDVHHQSLEVAATGVYSNDSISKVPHDLRARYFQRAGDLHQIVPELRKMVIFAHHDVTRDPPFTRIDLLSCRNMLIYLEPEVQRKVLATFHFGMKAGGCLFLGPSESIGELESEFAVADKHWKIYRKLRDVRLPNAAPITLGPPLRDAIVGPTAFVAKPGRPERDWLIPQVFDELLAKHVPPALLVDESFNLIHCFGLAREMLSLPEGQATLNVMKMTSGDLRTALNAALHRADQRKQAVVFNGIKSPRENELIQLTVEPYAKGGRKMFLISLEPRVTAGEPMEIDAESFDAESEHGERLKELERELDYTRESLQSTVEELETSNEELQATNEELVASNEELQSTNEELHSVNEELYTVNAEHQRKIEELTELTNDMDNLLRSTEIGTIFLDGELRIRRFTPAIAEAFNVLEQDVGRPIEHIAYNFEAEDWLEDAKRVLRTGEPTEREVRSKGGTAYLKRIRAYRTESNAIEGVVVTFVELTSVEAAQQLQRYADQLRRINKELQSFAYAVSHDLQAPLRSLVQFADILQQQFGVRLGDEGAELLDHVVQDAHRMKRLIQGLLAYSRIETEGKEFGFVDCELLLSRTLRALKPQIDECGASITSSKMPVVAGDERQLADVFRHLVENALRFRSEAAPKLDVQAKPIDNGRWQICVRDNGIGMASKDYERAFVVFQRLRPESEHATNGLGLALCKRIVERHGGHIWVESTPGEGSAFFFTLNGTA